jgi:branched-chain amino acid transport system substrate-binding protein
MRGLWFSLLLMWTLPAEAGELAPVRLGLVVPMASEAGPVAQSMQHAAEMALLDRGPVLGRPVALRVQDDPFDPKQATVTAERFVQEGVWGVVGHFYSSSSVPASAIYHQAGIPMVTATATHPRLTAQGFGNVFRVAGRDDQQAVTAAEWIVTRGKARRIAVVHDRTEYGQGLADALRREIARRPPRRVVAIETVPQGDKDFTAQVARVRASRPDVVYFGGIFREAAYLLRQLRQAGVSATFVSGDAVLDPEFVKLAGGDVAAGTYLTFAPDPRLQDSARPVIQRYESRYGSLGPYVLYVYDAVGVLLRAIQTGKPTDSSPDELRKVVRAIRGQAYRGALGTLRWDTHGDLTVSPYVMYVVRQGGNVQGWFEQVPVNSPAPAAKPPQS